MSEIHPIDKLVGKRVRQARIQKAVTQQELGEKLGITFQQVQKYETGFNRISSSRLWEISQIIGKPVNWFFARETQEVELDKDFIRFYQAWQKMEKYPQVRKIFNKLQSLVESLEHV